MHTDELDYTLPRELIARHPIPERSASRLLVVDRGQERWTDRSFVELPDLLKPSDVVVRNNTRVLPARFFLRRQTGGRIEGLWTACDADGTWIVLLRGASRLKIGEILHFEGAVDRFEVAVVSKGPRGEYSLSVSPTSDPATVLADVGTTPLPHYIRREDERDEPLDRLRYQTVYAKRDGAVAAPTAGLHFDEALCERMRDKGIEIVEVTLHVGLGTFQPIEVDRLADHPMHSECYDIQTDAWNAVTQARAAGRRIVAVGTTTARALESVASSGRLSGQTDILIYPPYQFKLIDSLITNFHLPRSTLLAMIYAFGGSQLMRRVYAHAIDRQYRFYSYGDAMLIE